MCAGNKACKSCAKVGKKNCSINGSKIMKKINFSVLKPAAAGLAGFAAAKMINKVPLGSGKTVGDNSLTAGIAKIAAAAILPSLIGNKVPLIKEAAVGVAIAGCTDIIRQYMPQLASYVAAPALPTGSPFPRKRDLGIACASEEVKYM